MYILKNANIYTSSPIEKADTIVTDGKEILYVGHENDSHAFSGEDAVVYDLKGKTVLPGIIDSHTHSGACAASSWHVRVPWTEDSGELLAFVKQFGEEHPKEEMPFIYFEYYPTSMFDENGPTKEMLDAAISDRPVLCQDFGEHLCWVNSRMLEAMGVDKNTPDPSKLEIFVRDKDGNPTGWVKEMAWRHFAEKMYDEIGWRPPEDLTWEGLHKFFDFFSESGITAMFDALIETDDQIKAIYEADKAGKLHTYYDAAVRFWTYEDLPKWIDKLKEYRTAYTTDHIKLNTMKLFLDGTNESGNSASLHEHIHDPGNFGEIMMETEELTKCFLLCNREGLDLHIHMVGDRAFRVGCDAVQAAQKAAAENNEPWVCRPIFAHCEVVDPADMKRPAELGILINWSCHWSGGYFGEEAMNYYSEEKWRRMYKFDTMLESGASIAFSSDVVTFYEMHRAYPFFGMQVAATRVDPEFPLDPEKYPGSVRPEESSRFDIKTLVRGYTIDGAKQLRWQDKMGSLEAGKIANLIVTDKDPYETAPKNLKDIKVEAVMFDGEIVSGGM